MPLQSTVATAGVKASQVKAPGKVPQAHSRRTHTRHRTNLALDQKWATPEGQVLQPLSNQSHSRPHGLPLGDSRQPVAYLVRA